ncbi:MAG: carboxypeptidase regulatory-like domain-containing protein [Acidobacteriota bacterium]
MLNFPLCRTAWATLLVVGCTATAAGAQQAGSLDGFVLTAEGDPLSGVIVTLSGRSANYRQVSDGRGAIGILGMEPGNYSLRAVHDGYQPANYPTVEILVGRTTSLQIKMSAVPGETLVVTSEPPLLASRPEAQGIRLGSFELDSIPTTRDPWAVVAQAPGVILDTVNAGGNKTNLQPTFVGGGASRAQNNFVLDGVQVTDMAAAGTSPLAYDFDQIEEARVTLGGPDAAAPSSGVLVDLVTKRGTSVWRGSARDFTTNEKWQSAPRQTSILRPTEPGPLDPRDVPPHRGSPGGQRFDSFSVSSPGGKPAGRPEPPAPRADASPRFLGAAAAATSPQGESLEVGRIKGIDDYGLEGGGPLISERLFGWFSYGATNARQIAVGGSLDRAEILNLAGKVNATLGTGNSLSLTVHRADKTRRDLGAGPERAPETLQRLLGKTDIWKIEDSILRQNLFLTVLASNLDGKVDAEPFSGGFTEPVLDPHGIWRGAFSSFSDERSARQLQLDLRTFLAARPGSHEPRLGLSLREFASESEERWGPRDLIQVAGENTGTLYDVVRAFRPGQIGSKQRYKSFWTQDEMRGDRLTLTAGLRFDEQTGTSEATEIGANPAFPDLLPAVRFSGSGPDFRWRSLSPRLGASYAVGADHHIVLRAGYSRFASQLHTTLVDRLHPLDASSATFSFTDTDGDGIYDAGEPILLLSTQGIDPNNPTALASPNQTDPGLAPELTDELTFGFERLVRPDLVMTGQFTARRVSNVLESRRLVRDAAGNVRLATAADYSLWEVQATTLPNGRIYRVPIYTLDDSLTPTGGRRLVNGDRRQDYHGLSLGLTKRLSRGWMLRGNATWSDWRWRTGPEFRRYDDPTNLAPGNGFDSFDGDGDHESVAEQAPGSGGSEGAFLNSRWVFNLNGLVQVAPSRPWGFHLAGNFSARQGYPIAYALRVTPPDGIARNVQVTHLTDAARYDNPVVLDLRCEKEWIIGETSAVISIDGFNVLNRNTSLIRERFVNSPQGGALREALGPRVFRLGVRLRWR